MNYTWDYFPYEPANQISVHVISLKILEVRCQTSFAELINPTGSIFSMDNLARSGTCVPIRTAVSQIEICVLLNTSIPSHCSYDTTSIKKVLEHLWSRYYLKYQDCMQIETRTLSNSVWKRRQMCECGRFLPLSPAGLFSTLTNHIICASTVTCVGHRKGFLALTFLVECSPLQGHPSSR